MAQLTCWLPKDKQLSHWYQRWIWGVHCMQCGWWNMHVRITLTLKPPKRTNYRPRSIASEGYVFTWVCYGIGHMVTQGGWHWGWHRGSVPWQLRKGRTPLPEGRPPGSHTPQEGRPPGGREPANTVNARAVSILLECILVLSNKSIKKLIFLLWTWLVCDSHRHFVLP